LPGFEVPSPSLIIDTLTLAPKPESTAVWPKKIECSTGSVTVILGRNHSGKTALCRLLAGLPTAATAAVSVGGQSMAGLRPAQRPVAMVQQAFVNYPHWTVAENLASPLRARGVPAAQRAERASAIAESLGLAGLLTRLPEQLSGGQQQRLAIGRALAKDARVLVLDEPFVNLDYKLREGLEQELLALARQQGLVLVYASSDPREAFALADQLVLLDAHCLLQVGAPAQVYREPVSHRAAQLLSEQDLNALGGGHWLRPEHLSLEVPATHSFSTTLVVHGLETNGSQTFLHGARAEHPEEPLWHARLDGMPAMAVGDAVPLHARSCDVLDFSDR
jgi:glycerol transport system ATP-binding protein